MSLRTVTLIVGGTSEARAAAGRRVAEERGAETLFEDHGAAAWPFRRHAGGHVPADADFVVAPDVHEAFPAGQTGGTRLVLTQSTYQLQRWLDWLDARRGKVHLVAEADREGLRRNAPEAFSGRGPWARANLIEVEPERTERAERSEGRSDRDD